MELALYLVFLAVLGVMYAVIQLQQAVLRERKEPNLQPLIDAIDRLSQQVSKRRLIWFNAKNYETTEGKTRSIFEAVADDGTHWSWDDDAGWLLGRLKTAISQLPALSVEDMARHKEIVRRSIEDLDEILDKGNRADER